MSKKKITVSVSPIPTIRESWQRHVATCRHCGAIILWCTTQRGKQMPVDIEPIKKSLVPEQGRFSIDGAAPFVYHDVDADPAYISHFCVCPGVVKNPPQVAQREHWKRYRTNQARIMAQQEPVGSKRVDRRTAVGSAQLTLTF